jgi:hypothetical protein
LKLSPYEEYLAVSDVGENGAILFLFKDTPGD